jgi:hypothetical protein
MSEPLPVALTSRHRPLFTDIPAPGLYSTSSISLIRQLLSKNGSNGL